MNSQEKQIHTMVQRLAHLDKEYTKARAVSRQENIEKKNKREAKIQEKRDVRKKEVKKKAYMKGNRSKSAS